LGSTHTLARIDKIPGSRYVSARGAAMADAFLPLGQDGGSGLFYNPAVLGHLKEFHFEPLNFQLSPNSDFISSFDRNFVHFTSLSDYKKRLDTRPGIFPGAGTTIFPNFFMRGFAFGVLAHADFASMRKIGAPDEYYYRTKYQLIPAVGFGVRMANGIVRMGYSLQWVNETSGEKTVPLGYQPLNYREGMAQGGAFSHNAGIALTIPIAHLPQLNIVARNIGGASFDKKNILRYAVNADPKGIPAQPMTIDLSLNAVQKTGGGSYINACAVYRDFTNQSGFSLLQRATLGLEYSLRDQFFLRGGWGSWYPSAGIGMRRKRGEFNLSWYSAEIGTTEVAWREVRVILEYKIRAF